MQTPPTLSLSLSHTHTHSLSICHTIFCISFECGYHERERERRGAENYFQTRIFLEPPLAPSQWSLFSFFRLKINEQNLFVHIDNMRAEGREERVCVSYTMKEREGERERDSKRDVSSDPTSNTNLHFYSGRELDILVDIYANNVTGNMLAKEHMILGN